MKTMMIQHLLMGALVGGVTAFVWGAISWMVLPWHHSTFKEFRDERAVAQVLLENAPQSGVYGLPAPPKTVNGQTQEQRQAAEAALTEQMKRGPLVMAIIQRQGPASLTKPLIAALVIYCVAALILTWLLLQTTGFSFLGRAGFVALAALAGTLICRLTDWNWHGYSTSYTVVAVADVCVGWFLVGMAIAAVARPNA